MFQDWIVFPTSEKDACRHLKFFAETIEGEIEVGFPLYLDDKNGASKNIMKTANSLNIRLIRGCLFQCSCGTFVMIEKMKPKGMGRDKQELLIKELEEFNMKVLKAASQKMSHRDLSEDALEQIAEERMCNMIEAFGIPPYAMEAPHFSELFSLEGTTSHKNQLISMVERTIASLGGPELPSLKSFQRLHSNESVYIVHPTEKHIPAIETMRFDGIIIPPQGTPVPIMERAYANGMDIVYGTGKNYLKQKGAGK